MHVPAASLHLPDANQRDLTTQGLIKLAEAVASSTHPEVDIPLEILVVIEDVIGGRQASAEWYAGTGGGSDDATRQANHRHRNFIEVLKQILKVLSLKYEDRLPRWEKKKPQKLKQEKAKIVENIYQYLDIEELIDSSPNSQDGSPKDGPPQQPQPTRHAPGSLAKDIEETDKIFALWCYFKDQYDSCNFLKEAWQEYKDGELSLQTVCQVTDTAFMLMKKACATLVTEYPQFADMHDVDSFLGFEKSTVGGKLTIVAFREKLARPDGDCSKPALHELFCTKASCIMDHFGLMVCTQVNIPLDARNLSNAFAPCLYSLAPEIRLLAQADLFERHTEKHVPLVHEDNFLNGLIKLCKSKCLSPWLITACQAYMHIYDALDSRVVEGHEELHSVAPKLGQAMAEHKKYMMSLHDWVWPPLMSPGIDYFRRHLLQQVERDQMRRLQEHFPMVPWPDMDWFCAQHDKPRPFVLDSGETAQPLEAFAKHYRIALGAKPSAGLTFKWFTRRDAIRPKFQYAEIPQFDHNFKHGRILGSSSFSPYLHHMNQEVAKNPAYTRGASPWNGLQELVLHKIAYGLLEEQQSGSGAGKLGNKSTAVQLLTGFKQMLKTDELNFNFDYFGFLRSCSRIMATVMSVCDPGGVRGVTAASRLVNIILWEGAATEKPKSTLTLRGTMLSRCGSLLADHIEHGGSEYIDQATFRCGRRESTSANPATPILSGALRQLTMDPDVFYDMRDGLKEKHIECDMDMAANVMTLYIPRAKTTSEVHEFLYTMWDAKMKPTGRAESQIRPSLDRPSHAGVADSNDDIVAKQDRAKLGRKIRNAFASL
ncbi:hypothetical protein LTR22_012904 [Elasticomyces elasticus]|nr:hypothetical protein LTR22_012904 [Elasticomyces elasticus]KAK4933069.1 hypothetical protein LTR49_000553 [Elasticomyces elasticus]KAK5763968.1 hypothetical protein LTS12_005878 [Elasticomyces elasticus]